MERLEGCSFCPFPKVCKPAGYCLELATDPADQDQKATPTDADAARRKDPQVRVIKTGR